MTQFVYKVNLKGEESSGIIQAKDITEASQKLQEKGGYILTLKPRFSFGPLRTSAWLERIIALLAQRMNPSEKILFTTQLGAMLQTGLPIIEAIEAFVEEKPTSSAVILRQITNEIKAGKKLSGAMAAHPRVFGKLYISLVKAGEEMGTLGKSLVYLGEQLKREYELTTKIRSAMIYPLVILTAMVAVMSFIAFSVIPKIATFAQNANVDLPRVTQLIINLTNFFKKNGLGLSIVSFCLILFLWQVMKTKKGKRIFDTLMLKTPIFGKLVRRYNQIRFCRLLAGFFKYGISINNAFDILAESLGNSHYSASCRRQKSKLTVGRTFSEALKTEKDLFPPIMARVVRGAEQTGVLDKTLLKLAKFYERELETSLVNLTSLIEPIMVMFLGLGVVGVALSVILPIYRVTSQIR